ncbi:response regulator transcription factor [uncultured Pseudoteredinibacter sp.]|uniref:response regulator transcription factor n=1 Tax=uncultured Pseudoteredinibacter sp. TaxID=1641701 RepID=UPI00261A92E6|nr:response regulator transcription factor [uncultured Pseudoteredinibacter sp.]
MNIHLLVIEDNQAIAGQLIDFLTGKGFIVDYAHNGRVGLQLLRDNQFDVIILDLMLPDMDGLDICETVRAEVDANVPILMLTARDSLDDKIRGFDSGTDDYLTKPFELEEVAMRCKALAKRRSANQSESISIGGLLVDSKKKLVSRDGQSINLSVTDFAILLELAKAFPSAVSRNELTRKIWGEDFPDSDVLRSHIYTLRKAIDKPFEYPMIKTIHGAGFRLTEE